MVPLLDALATRQRTGFPESSAQASVLGPASSGDERWIPQHVHCEVEAPRHARRQFQLVFRDDPRMTSHWQKWAANDGHPIIELVRDGAGTLRGTCDIVLRPE